MRKPIIVGAAIMASLALAGTAQADTVTTSFDGFADGSVNGQDGWLATNSNIDQEIVAGSFRMSNARTQGSFGDMPHSKPVLHAAGESEGANRLVNEFTITSAVPNAQQPGLFVSVAPDDGQGSRMSQLRFEDRADGVHVIFTDATFVPQDIATLDRSVKHDVEIETTFVHGHDNDVVRVSIDGDEIMRGGSWENYYRFEEERNPSATDRLMFRAGGADGETNPTVRGGGFLFDNVTSKSSHVDNPAPLNPPAPGPAGPQGPSGKDGAAGLAGKDGAAGPAGKDGVNGMTTVVHDYGTIAGASMRTVRIHKIKGMKFVSARASLRGKRLPVQGRKVKVDLRGKSVGEYRVRITAKYKADGKVYKVRSVRSLSIVRN